MDGKTLLSYVLTISLLFGVFTNVMGNIDLKPPVSLPTTKLRTADCGISDFHFNMPNIWADAVSGASSYKFKFIRTSDSTSTEYTSTTRQCTPYAVSFIDYGNSYYVLVKALIGSEWAEYGDTCLFHMMDSIPPPVLKPYLCSQFDCTLTTVLASSIHTSAQEHIILCVDTLTADSFLHHKVNYNPNIFIYSINGPTGHMKHGSIYRVYCKAKVRDVWSDYGEPCLIGLDSVMPTTKLIASTCRKTDLTPGANIAALNMHATDYQYEFKNKDSGQIDTLTKGSGQYHINTALLSGIGSCQQYDVRVRWLNVDQWSDFGETCHIWNTCSIPSIKIDEPNCNNLEVTIDETFYSEDVTNADSIQWVFLDSSHVEIHRLESSSNNITPSNITELSTDEYYWVQVRAKVGSQWGVFLDTCFVSFNLLVDSSVMIIDTERLFYGITLEINLGDTIIHSKSGEIVEIPRNLINSESNRIILNSSFKRNYEYYLLGLNTQKQFDSVYTIHGLDTLTLTNQFVHVEEDKIVFHRGDYEVLPVYDPPPVYPDLINGIVLNPNGNGIADSLKFHFNVAVNTYELIVKDRNENIVFQTTDSEVSWDCKDGEGELIPRGPYKYEIQLNGDTIQSQFLLNY